MTLSGAWYNAQQPGWGITFNTQGKTQVAHLTLYAGCRPTWIQGVVDSTSTSLSLPPARKAQVVPVFSVG
ncbi:hypothetical protein MYXA107069_02100 [Myxococcus xanthus]|uniref:hypothetical protein n=1 Tax=Myxococcus TaxID=32 RepID=UPI0003172AEC|nr:MULTISPECIES: hypothetical protein [Myxococcus]NOJ54593.1 hypothetical protein [Myxococcus xanthus]QZZ49944.1 hypothetical protein MyxoNM_12120 [Myxococcus xanthus]UYI25989.1 hypothetical protein N1129_11985 [Myxococcus xanthus]SDX02153.1 serine protease [Myxococcus xanthus]